MKIVDISTLVPGPFTSFLCQKYLNTEVIKFEDTANIDQLKLLKPTRNGIGFAYQTINKNKNIQNISFREDLNLITQELKNAAVFIHNLRSQKAFKMSLSYEDVMQINPNIIYVSISGYPENHPMQNKAAHDLNILALSGYLYAQENNLHVPPILLADIFTSYNATIQIMSSLIKQQNGNHLRISMYEAFLEATTVNNMPQIETRELTNSKDYIMSGDYPCYSIYQAKDGYVAVAAIEKPLWIDFCIYIKKPELIEKQFDRDIKSQIQEVLILYEKNTWLSTELDMCVTPVCNLIEMKNLGLI